MFPAGAVTVDFNNMAYCELWVVLAVFLLPFKPTQTFPQSGLDLRRSSRTQRDVPCRADLEYLHGNICCLNCPAGTYVKAGCTTAGEKGVCEKCGHGEYIEHPNGLHRCFKCTSCRSDKEIVRQCTATQNAKCGCKSGSFCAPNEACEVCRKCLRCGKDEVVVRNCTSTTNTVCKKVQVTSSSASEVTAVVVPVLLILSGLIIVAVCLKRRQDPLRSPPDENKADLDEEHVGRSRSEETQGSICSNWLPVRSRFSAGVEEERKVLRESLGSSASNSQHSLTSLPSSADTTGYPFPDLVPLDGEESLKKCFEYFVDMDFDYHKRFFRNLGINDNVIKSRESLLYEDKIHELLGVWVEKKGRDASLNELLKVLFDLNQRRTAETIREKAVKSGHYMCGVVTL